MLSGRSNHRLYSPGAIDKSGHSVDPTLLPYVGGSGSLQVKGNEMDGLYFAGNIYVYELTRVKETSCCFPAPSYALISVVIRQFTVGSA